MAKLVRVQTLPNGGEGCTIRLLQCMDCTVRYGKHDSRFPRIGELSGSYDPSVKYHCPRCHGTRVTVFAFRE